MIELISFLYMSIVNFAVPKPLEEVLDQVKDFTKVLIAGCDGCVTVYADKPKDKDPNYPQSEQWKKLKALIDKTKPVAPNPKKPNDTYLGKIKVQR